MKKEIPALCKRETASLPPELTNLPKAPRGAFLEFLDSLRSGMNSWYQLHSREDRKFLLPASLAANELFETLGENRLRFLQEQGGCDWSGEFMGAFQTCTKSGQQAAWFAAQRLAGDVVRQRFKEAIQEMPGNININDVTWPIAYGVAHNVASCAALQTTKDLPGFTEDQDSVFLSYLKLYKMGAARVDLRRMGENIRLMVDFPTIVDGNAVLGCVAFNQDGSFDKKILYTHGWDASSCSQRKPIESILP